MPPAPPPLEPVGDGTRSTARWATTGAGTTVELAGIWARLAARVLDMVLVVSVTAFGTAALYGALFNDASTTAAARVLAALVTVGVGVLYEVWLIAVKGQTVGKLAVGIEVRRADVGELPGWDSSVRRWLLPGLASVASNWVSQGQILRLVGLVVYASLLWDRNRQGWHDKIANTLVVRKGRPIVWLIVVISVVGVAFWATLVILAILLLGSSPFP